MHISITGICTIKNFLGVIMFTYSLTYYNMIYFHSGIDHIRKIHGHKSKDEADPEKAATKYSQLFKSIFDPLYETLEGTTLNLQLTEKESSFLVNRMFQVFL